MALNLRNLEDIKEYRASKERSLARTVWGPYLFFIEKPLYAVISAIFLLVYGLPWLLNHPFFNMSIDAPAFILYRTALAYIFAIGAFVFSLVFLIFQIKFGKEEFIDRLIEATQKYRLKKIFELGIAPAFFVGLWGMIINAVAIADGTMYFFGFTEPEHRGMFFVFYGAIFVFLFLGLPFARLILKK